MKIKLEEVRMKKGWSQRKLSLISGVSRSYISQIESGQYIPTADILCKLSKALECTINDLVDCEVEDKNGGN